MLFITMLSFQLAGALILLLNCVIGNKKAVIRNCFPGSNVIERDDNDNCIIPREKLQASAHSLYLNIVAFADLVIGYLFAAFSPSPTFGTEYTVLGVIGMTVIVLLLEYFLSRWTAKATYAKDMEVEYSELEKIGVETFATKKEVDALFNDVFDD